MPEPNLQGVWVNSGDASSSPAFKENVSVFKFTLLNEGDKTAAFAICDEASAQKTSLAGLRRGWMSTACFSDGFAPANTRVISTVKYGVAALQDDGSWKVRDLAKVEYLP
jgi:hypothetical protein